MAGAREVRIIEFLPADGLDVDAQTRRDLDLFGSERSPASIFDWLDTTRTVGGREKLRALLRHPRARVTEIETVQAAVRYLADSDRRTGFDLRVTDRRLHTVANYLESYVSVLPGPLTPLYVVRALWTMMSYRKYFEQISTGLRNLHRLLQSVRRFLDATAQTEVPAWLAAYRSECANLLAEPTVQRFLEHGGRDSSFPFWRVYQYDAVFRRAYRDGLERLLEICHELDALRSLGRVVERESLVFPRFSGGPDEGGPWVRAGDLTHPLVPDAVANDVSLGRGPRFLFITGPNMAGKTTFMKALGLAVYLAHLGMGVSARSLELRVFDGICSSLNVEDNLAQGYSFYFAEVKRVKSVAERLQQGLRLLVLFDELFKGTNVRDALDGSRMVVEGFRSWPESAFVLSTHLLELAEEIEADGALSFRCFESEVVEGRPRFSYRMRDGISRDRLGMLILENEGVPRLLEPPSGA